MSLGGYSLKYVLSTFLLHFFVKMHVMIGIFVGFDDFYVTYDKNIIRQA